MIPERTVIPSIRELKYLQRALKSSSSFILLADAHIGNLKLLCKECHQQNKKVLIHMDLLGGFKADSIGIRLLKDMFKVDGVISSNCHILRSAKKIGLLTIFRVFLIDSRSLNQSIHLVEEEQFDAIEILPGELASSYVDYFIKSDNQIDLIAGGFIQSKALVNQLFDNGFKGLTSSEESLWK